MMWSGVIFKFVMFGVFFYYVMLMKDLYFDLFKSYEYYYFLKEDFSNFEEFV